MVKTGTLLGLAGLGLQLSSRAQAQEKEKAAEDMVEDNGEAPAEVKAQKEAVKAQEEANERLERLEAIETTNNPAPEDKDAFTSSVIELADGETATVTVTPQDGAHLYVKRVAFDRRADHDYEINVGGEVSSVAHRAVYAKPKKLVQSDKVTATVTNDSGSTTTIDFELEAWGRVQ